MPTTHSGTCACTSTTWTSASPPTHLDYCHCTQCQRISGAPFIAWLGFPSQSLSFRGTDSIKTIRLTISDGMDSIATRSCCVNCGGTLSMQYDCYKDEKIHIAAGTMEQGQVGEEVERSHIWVKEKVAWFRLPEDGVRQWEGFDEEFEETRRKFEARQRRETYEPVKEVPGGYEDLEEREDDEVVIRRAEERARKEEEEGGESDEELRELQRKYGGNGTAGNARREVEVEEWMYDSD